MSQSFEVTKEGVKLPYGRFLSDSAGGYIVMVLVLYAVLTSIRLPFGLGTWRTILPVPDLMTIKDQVGAAGILTVGVLIVLLGSPIGLMLNGLSYFTLGFTQFAFTNYWATHQHQRWMRIITASTAQEFNRHVLVHAFDFLHTSSHSTMTFYDRVRFLEQYLEIHFPHHVHFVEHLEGLKIFVRNLAFLALVGMLYSFSLMLWGIGSVFGLLVAGLLFYACLITIYHYSQVLFTVYTLCLDSAMFDPSRQNTFGQTVAALRVLARHSRTSQQSARP